MLNWNTKIKLNYIQDKFIFSPNGEKFELDNNLPMTIGTIPPSNPEGFNLIIDISMEKQNIFFSLICLSNTFRNTFQDFYVSNLGIRLSILSKEINQTFQYEISRSYTFIEQKDQILTINFNTPKISHSQFVINGISIFI